MKKKMIALVSLLTLVAHTAFAADSVIVEKDAHQVSGFDKLSNTAATDCTYMVAHDGMDQNLIVIGVNSESAPYNNALIRIPVQNLPLQDGFAMTDIRGNQISYENGVLRAKRQKRGEGVANEKLYVELEVSADLTQISSARVQKLEGLIINKTLSQMECLF